VRYGLGAAMVLAGIVMIIITLGGFGVEGFTMAVGGGLSVLLINFLFRLGVSGDREREEEARSYFDEHGVWPDEDNKPSQREWRPASGVLTPEQEERQRRQDRAWPQTLWRLGRRKSHDCASTICAPMFRSIMFSAASASPSSMCATASRTTATSKWRI
jgi:hypothetical protein